MAPAVTLRRPRRPVPHYEAPRGCRKRGMAPAAFGGGLLLPGAPRAALA